MNRNLRIVSAVLVLSLAVVGMWKLLEAYQNWGRKRQWTFRSCLKLALDRGIGGPLLELASYFMKTPPVQYKDDICHEKTEAFIKGEGNK